MGFVMVLRCYLGAAGETLELQPQHALTQDKKADSKLGKWELPKPDLEWVCPDNRECKSTSLNSTGVFS